jgi:MFS transporter, ACS family, glucarate transporter
MITYIDRVVIGTAMPFISKEFGFSLATSTLLIAAFNWGYSLFQIPGAWLGDILGPRRALALIVVWWSLFTSLTSASWNATSMAVFRFLFGVGESGAFPIATRSLSRWMLPMERGFAQSITHAGSRIGAALTPPLVVWLISGYGWRSPFVVFGAVGILWAAVWYFYYRNTPAEHKSLNQAERDLIARHIPPPKPRKNTNFPWEILRSHNLWTLSMMYFCYGYCLQLYLTIFPTYLNSARGVNLKTMGLYASLPLFAGTVGDLLGGWISDWIGHRTGNLRMARKVVAVTGFLIAAAFIVPATLAESAETCVALTCVAVFGLELTVGVSWAVPLDIGGDLAGSVSAVMNTLGNIGGAIAPTIFAALVAGSYWERPYLLAAVLCVVAALLFLRIDASKPIANTMR